MGNDQESSKERSEYRNRARLLLKEREELLSQLEASLLQVAAQLKEYDPQKLVKSGNVESIMQGDKYRKKLNQQKAKIQSQMHELKNDINKAKERLIVIEDEMRDLAEQGD